MGLFADDMSTIVFLVVIMWRIQICLKSNFLVYTVEKILVRHGREKVLSRNGERKPDARVASL